MPVSPQYCLDIALARAIECKAALVEGVALARLVPDDDQLNNGVSLYGEMAAALAAATNALLAIHASVRRLDKWQERPRISESGG